MLFHTYVPSYTVVYCAHSLCCIQWWMLHFKYMHLLRVTLNMNVNNEVNEKPWQTNQLHPGQLFFSMEKKKSCPLRVQRWDLNPRHSAVQVSALDWATRATQLVGVRIYNTTQDKGKPQTTVLWHSKLALSMQTHVEVHNWMHFVYGVGSCKNAVHLCTSVAVGRSHWEPGPHKVCACALQNIG
jgi:hypothetical protein